MSATNKLTANYAILKTNLELNFVALQSFQCPKNRNVSILRIVFLKDPYPRLTFLPPKTFFPLNICPSWKPNSLTQEKVSTRLAYYSLMLNSFSYLKTWWWFWHRLHFLPFLCYTKLYKYVMYITMWRSLFKIKRNCNWIEETVYPPLSGYFLVWAKGKLQNNFSPFWENEIFFSFANSNTLFV